MLQDHVFELNTGHLTSETKIRVQPGGECVLINDAHHVSRADVARICADALSVERVACDELCFRGIQ